MNTERENLPYSNTISVPEKIFSFGNEVYFELDIDSHKLTYISPSVKNLTGYLPEQLIDIKIEDLLLYYDKNNIEKILILTINYGIAQNIEFELVTKSQNIIFCRANTFLINKDSSSKTIVAGVITSIDEYIREKIKKERIENKLHTFIEKYRKYELAIDNNPLAIIFCDANGNVEYINETFIKQSGYDYNDILGKSISILKSGFHDKIFFEQIHQTITKGLTWQGEILNKRKNGQLYWVQTIIMPIRSDKGDIINYLYIYEDIEKKKEMEKLLTTARIKAEQANQAKTEFLATMSHEIRNPMNAIIGNIELLAATNTDKEQKKLIKRLSSSSESLLFVINDILDISKIEAGQLEIEERPFDFHEMIDTLIDSLQSKARKKNLELKKETHNIPEKIKIIGDQHRLNQILLNLLNNAVKFTEYGHVNLKCSGQIMPELNKININFSVEDTGIGISQDKLDSIFEKFKQEDSSVSRKYGGTGLGLSISKKLVALMGGDLLVESKKNFGSRFYFTLAFEIDRKNEKFNTDSNISSALKNPHLFEGKVFLVVDDLEFNVELAANLLKNWGAQVLKAANGKEAIEKIKKNPRTDVILMDLRMPETDGLEATRILREQYDFKKTIIGLTGEILKEKLNECFKAGMDGYITKPFKKKEFLESILKFIDINEKK